MLRQTSFHRRPLESSSAKELERFQAEFPNMVLETEAQRRRLLQEIAWRREYLRGNPDKQNRRVSGLLAEEVFNPMARVTPQRMSNTTLLKVAGLKTTTRVDGKTVPLIQSALLQSLVLRPFIATKLGKISIAKNLVQYPRDDGGFDHAFQKLNKIVVPLGSKELINVGGFYHRATDSIYLRSWANVGLVLRLATHKFSSAAFYNFFGKSLADGLGLYFTNLVLQEQGLEQLRPENFKVELDCATDLVGLVGPTMVGRAYFQDHSDLLKHLMTKLSIGPVPAKDLMQDALCKTPLLLRTAAFASHPIERMVAVGITGLRSVRLWMRTDVPGMHEVQILGDPRGARIKQINIQPGKPGDQTTAITYGPPNDPPLDPLRKYKYRVVRTSDRKTVGDGSFETAPASDSDTPDKVVIALMSCHQPFKNDGTILPESARMLNLLPRILKDNNVKFVLPCGDQIYADDPGAMSLYENPYLIRQAVPGIEKIGACSAEEVRRVFDMRYRTFWSMKPIREMYANYPCYPTLDDHEIIDAWGSLEKHSEPGYANIMKGALSAYFDYQASSILPQMPPIPGGSFHYHFSYGNIGIFVMDIRSQRYSHSHHQIYSQKQFEDLRQFLLNNRDKKVVFIVSSVPVFFVPGKLADFGATRRPTTFLDHWSHKNNRPSRDAFLSLLHEHQQQARPDQRVAILSGDVHIGNACGIQWQEGNKPWLYQFTSSPISVKESWTTKTEVRLAPRLLTMFDETVNFSCTPSGKKICSGRVSKLPGVKGASQNPVVGMNVGLIEVQRNGNVSKLKFKLIGAHPTKEGPVTHFESDYLG